MNLSDVKLTLVLEIGIRSLIKKSSPLFLSWGYYVRIHGQILEIEHFLSFALFGICLRTPISKILTFFPIVRGFLLGSWFSYYGWLLWFRNISRCLNTCQNANWGWQIYYQCESRPLKVTRLEFFIFHDRHHVKLFERSRQVTCLRVLCGLQTLWQLSTLGRTLQ